MSTAHVQTKAQPPAIPLRPAPTERALIEIGSTSDPAEHEANRVRSNRAVGCRDLGAAAVGTPLPSAPRVLLEAGLGRDFKGVRVHTDHAAGELTEHLGANAFTLGRDIFFAPGRYRPDTEAGRRLLAHEAAHVLQQEFTAPTDEPLALVSSPDLEAQADDTAAAVVEGRSLAPVLGRAQGIQRQVAPALPRRMQANLPGEPAEGYESPRPKYTEFDRETLHAQVKARTTENATTVENFQKDWAAELLRLWTGYATDEMAKAASHASLDLWEKLAKFIIQKSVEALVTGGAGLVWEAELSWFTKKAISFATGLAGDKVKGVVTGEDVEPKLSSTRQKLLVKTEALAQMVKDMPGSAGEAVDTIDKYDTWLFRASLADLAQFRIPARLPAIPPAEISASVATAIVGALHESHVHDSVPYYKNPMTGDSTDVDPTLDDPISLFDDNIAIVHLTIGTGRAVARQEAEIYTPSRVLLPKVIGLQLRQMPGVPLFITISPQPGADLLAAKEVISALRSESPDLLPRTDQIADDEHAAFAFASAYPKPDKSMRLIRWNNSVGERVTLDGGALAERLWMYRWGHGDNLAGLARAILRELELKDHQADRDPAPKSSSFSRSSPAELAETTWRLLDTEDGAKRLVAEYVLGLTAQTPEDRWKPEYFGQDNRDRLRQRDPSRIVRYRE